MNADWISVKDRLPKENTIVVVICQRTRQQGKVQQDEWHLSVERATTKNNMWQDGTALYWFPLPPLQNLK